MLVLIGKMGSGKDTIKQNLINDLGMKNCCTYTTRPKRPGEEDGKEYHFITDKEFETKKKDKFFATTSEYNTVNGIWKYGTALSDLVKTSNSVIILNPKEVKDMKENLLLNNHIKTNTKICYLIAGSNFIWERLVKRGDASDEMARRMEQDEEDFKDISNYIDFAVRNENIGSLRLARIIYEIYQRL